LAIADWESLRLTFFVIPAKAGIQVVQLLETHWIPARASLGRNDGQAADINRLRAIRGARPSKHRWKSELGSFGSLSQYFTPL
jgi:hypothetical protein